LRDCNILNKINNLRRLEKLTGSIRRLGVKTVNP
jgi:hypothetical protein